MLPNLSSEHASEYRSRFEEWISRNKTYCPKPSCSAFIPDRIVENAKPLVPTTIRGFLNNILSKMSASPSSRFVREELDITYMPGDTSVIASPIYLADMQAKLEEYESLEGLTQDVQLLVSNAHLHGSDHPIAQAADELFNLCLHEISKSFDQQSCEIGALSSFACPACNIAICAQCKKSEHRGQACDDSEHEQEMAMLEKFGYKQCPHCRTGVRKMFGCSFMCVIPHCQPQVTCLPYTVCAVVELAGAGDAPVALIYVMDSVAWISKMTRKKSNRSTSSSILILEL